MDIRKRNGQPESYECGKIKSAILCAFASVNQEPGEARMDRIMGLVKEKVDGAVKDGSPLKGDSEKMDRHRVSAGAPVYEIFGFL